LINDTDANFRLWGKAISDQFSAGGLVQTADTGQVNWATVTAPGAANTFPGYEMWRSNDAAGGINNWYMRIDYGANQTGATYPRVKFQCGWGSDGSGNLTGVTSTALQPQINTAPSATAGNCNLAAGNNWLCMVMGDASTRSFIFSVERTRNASGTEQNELLIISGDVATYWKTQVINETLAYTQETSTSMLAYPPSASAVVGGKVGIGIAFGNRAGLTNPSLNLFGVNNTQLGAAQSTVSLNAYGGSHTYIINTNTTSLYWGAVTNLQTLSRFE